MLTLQLFGTNYSHSGENRCGGVLPSSWYYREPLTSTMLILRPPLSSDRFYLSHNYSLFEARSSTGYIKVSCFSLFRLDSFSVFIPDYDDECIVARGAGQALTSVTYTFGERRTNARARARVSIRRKGVIAFVALRKLSRPIADARVKWSWGARNESCAGSWTGSRLSIGNLLTSRLSRSQTGFTLDWKEIFCASLLIINSSIYLDNICIFFYFFFFLDLQDYFIF